MKKYKGITWPNLIRGILLKRYKRFLADVKLEGGKIITAHCPNTGSMLECSESGQPVYLSFHDNPPAKTEIHMGNYRNARFFGGS